MFNVIAAVFFIVTGSPDEAAGWSFRSQQSFADQATCEAYIVDHGDADKAVLSGMMPLEPDEFRIELSCKPDDTI